MKAYICSKFFALIILVSFLGSCSEDEVIGPDLTNCNDPVTLVSPLAVTTVLGNSSDVNFLAGDSVFINAEFDQPRFWTLTITGDNGAVYTTSGESSVINEFWDGSITSLPLFTTGVNAIATLSFPCNTTNFSAPIGTLGSKKAYENLVFEITSFEPGSPGDIFWTGMGVTPTNDPLGIGIQFDLDDIDAGFAINSTIENDPAEGESFFFINSRIITSRTRDAFFYGGYARGGAYDITSSPNNVRNVSPGELNLDDVYVNLFVRSNGEPGPQVRVTLFTDTNGNGIGDGTDPTDFSYTSFTNVADLDDPMEWKHIWMPVSVFVPDGITSSELDLTNVIRMQVNVNNGTGLSNPEPIFVGLDYPTISFGGPLDIRIDGSPLPF